MTDRKNDNTVETRQALSSDSTQDTTSMQIRIRELEKEIAQLHKQIKEQRYGLTWLDVPEAFETESENKIPILEEVKEKAIDAAGRDALNASANNTPPNIIIEGDNYHALSCLNYTHRGKIDVIYIDPPYNTGNDGFTYKDKRLLEEFPDGSQVPKDHPLRHSYWLSFMSKRLDLAKNLLSDKGVIFISIDDNEQANLKLLCNKVFGEPNFIAQIIWERAYAPVNLKKHFSESHDYVLCYAKKIDDLVCNGLPRSDIQNKDYKNIDNDPRGPWKAGNPSVGPAVEKNIYEITSPSGRKMLPPSGRSWLYTKERFEEMLADNRIYWGKDGNSIWAPKMFLSEIKEGVTPMTIWKYNEVGHSQDATKELKDIFNGNALFSYPKSVRLIQRILELYSQNTSTILDFFAGSGTTLHATMKLNAEDGGHRQCILVQQREGDNNICENVTYERNRRVMCGYTNAKGEQVEGLGGRLKYYRTAFVGKNASHNATDADRVELSCKAGYLLALGENTLEEITHTDTYQIFADNKEKASIYTAIFFTENYEKLPKFVAEIEKLQSLKETLNVMSIPQINVYIFCWGTPDIFESEFDDLRGIALKAIPQPILDVYKSINQ